MRIKTMTTILSLAIIAGSTFAAEAQRAGAANQGNNRGNPQSDLSDRGAGDSESINRRLPCYVVGAASVDCPPERLPVNLPAHEEDCTCKPVAMNIAGNARLVLDCYQTKMFNGVKRTYICNKPE